MCRASPSSLQPPFPGAGEQNSAPQTEPNADQKRSADDRRSTEQSPLIAKVQSAQNGNEEATQAERKKQNHAADKGWADFVAVNRRVIHCRRGNSAYHYHTRHRRRGGSSPAALASSIRLMFRDRAPSRASP